MAAQLPFLGDFQENNTDSRINISFTEHTNLYKVKFEFDGNIFKKQDFASINETSQENLYVKMRKDGLPQCFINIISLDHFKMDEIDYYRISEVDKKA